MDLEQNFSFPSVRRIYIRRAKRMEKANKNIIETEKTVGFQPKTEHVCSVF